MRSAAAQTAEDHPRDAEFVRDHAETLGEKSRRERHLHLAAFGERIEKLLGLRDVVVFDVVPPASFTGSERYREHWQRWFDSMKGPIGFEMNDIQVVADGDVAFAHSVNRVVVDGQDNLVRATVGFRRIGGDWRVVHEHASVPLMMDMDPDDES